MKRVKLLAAVLGLCLSFVSIPAHAQGVWDPCPEGVPSSAVCSDTTGAEDIVKRIINLFLYAIGVLSVIMIIHSGLKYVTSRGDAAAVKSAKDTLLYAVVGLVVAILAFAIVNFVLGAFGGTSEEGQEDQETSTQEDPVSSGPRIVAPPAS